MLFEIRGEDDEHKNSNSDEEKRKIESSFTRSRCLSSYVTSNLPNYLTTIVALKEGFFYYKIVYY